MATYLKHCATKNYCRSTWARSSREQNIEVNLRIVSKRSLKKLKAQKVESFYSSMSCTRLWELARRKVRLMPAICSNRHWRAVHCEQLAPPHSRNIESMLKKTQRWNGVSNP